MKRVTSSHRISGISCPRKRWRTSSWNGCQNLRPTIWSKTWSRWSRETMFRSWEKLVHLLYSMRKWIICSPLRFRTLWTRILTLLLKVHI